MAFMRLRYCGSSIAQYSIIIVLIAIALVPIFLSVGNNLVGILEKYNINYGQVTTQMNANLSNIDDINDVTRGEVEVTCSGTECTIQAGNITINGIPDDFASIVETTGVSSSTDVLASILEQVADQLDKFNLTAEAEDIQQLANLGHKLAQAEYEFTSYDCTDNQAYCVFDVNPDLVAINNEFDTSLADFNTQLAVVMSSISSNPELAAIIQQPSNEILNLADDMSGAIVTDKHSCHYVLTNIIDSYANISTVTDMDSAIICASGHGSDAGYSCE